MFPAFWRSVLSVKWFDPDGNMFYEDFSPKVVPLEGEHSWRVTTLYCAAYKGTHNLAVLHVCLAGKAFCYPRLREWVSIGANAEATMAVEIQLFANVLPLR